MNNKFFENLPIYYINLERSKERRDALVDSFKEYGIKNYIRVNAVDARNIKDDSRVKYLNCHGKFSEVGMGHYGAVLSYFKAYNEFLKSPYEYAMICDDDMDFYNSVKMNFNFYDTLKYHRMKYYNLKTSTVNMLSVDVFRDQIQQDIKVNFLMKPSHLSYGWSSIINKKWADYILTKYKAHDIKDYENFYYDATPYRYNYRNTHKTWIVPACDAISFDKHTFLWIVFSPSETEIIGPNSLTTSNFNLEPYFYFGNLLKGVKEITIDTFKENGVLGYR